MAKKRVRRSVKKRVRSVGVKPMEYRSVEGQLQPLVAQLLKESEMRGAEYKRRYDFLCNKLVPLLTEDQVEHARIAGCAPEVYAVEMLQLYREKFFNTFQSSLWPAVRVNQE